MTSEKVDSGFRMSREKVDPELNYKSSHKAKKKSDKFRLVFVVIDLEYVLSKYFRRA